MNFFVLQFLSFPVFSLSHSIVCLLLKRGANLNLTDFSGSDPLSIAVNNTNADIVTL